MSSRKQFINQISGGALALASTAFLTKPISDSFYEELNSFSGSAFDIAKDEDFWATVQQAFTVDRSLINLNNGGVSPSPEFVQAAMKKHLDFSNQAPVYNMWRILEPRREGVRQRIARMFGVDTEEIALTRNASESLQICQLGIDLNKGDEVLTTDQDYPRMITTFQQRERREGIKLNQFSIPVPAENDDEIVSLFEQNITPKTKLILMSHIVNISGQILPVKKVVQMARKKGIPVIVDGAHAFAHFTFKQEDLDCDYYTTSLHKWLFAPHGTGMLYVRKNKIKDLWPMMAAPETMDENIRKFEEIGTHPAANFLAIGEALTFHEGIGSDRKEARLKYLNDYWIDQLIDKDRIVLHTSRSPKYACAIATVELKGIKPNDLTSTLWNDYRIITTPINHDQFKGIRVTPNVYTTLEELDRFVDAMKDQLKS
ncbi:MAG: aminotransferase class V-fold PLP-dependent enzyme [Balneola sp.]|nr:aminotransferase class V-fold PLP-dependent enzyme [Balneola sp.]MBO6650316.1 aminotransferase class V-fold PLP-dependent enzyme [Balneola sp.]MBO6712097.1 aminotransferase class V-fold PLP-dependent enzyme [Balneola sp.]MBO6800291.1 aminotransferase class V-fold PLP-dependent enzyme [Balneola sp.]MBO6869695.1 aminotransferase class V-fold PLP-dependent enzyme [Balneola sp.]